MGYTRRMGQAVGSRTRLSRRRCEGPYRQRPRRLSCRDCSERLAIVDTFKRRRGRTAIPRYDIGKNWQRIACQSTRIIRRRAISIQARKDRRVPEEKRGDVENSQAGYDPEAETLAHLGLSRVDFEEGNCQSALFHASKARKLSRGLDMSFGQAPLFMEAQSRRMLGNYNEAASLFRQSVELNRKIGDIGMVVAELTNLGFVEVHLETLTLPNAVSTGLRSSLRS